MEEDYNKKSVTKEDWQKWYIHKSNKEKWEDLHGYQDDVGNWEV